MARGKYEASSPVVVSFLRWMDTTPYLQHLSWYTRFRAVMELWFAAVRRDDKTYLARVKELTPEAVRGGPDTNRMNVMDSACGFFARFYQAMLEEPQDYLGAAYQAYSVRDTRNLAQYFTPDPVAKMMAAMTVSDMDPDQWRKDDGVRLLEPACGSGVMMIHALAEVYRNHGQWALNRTQAVLVDLDPICVAMAALQMAWLPFPVGSLILMQGDSLAGTEKVVWATGKGIAPTFERIVCKVEGQPC